MPAPADHPEQSMRDIRRHHKGELNSSPAGDTTVESPAIRTRTSLRVRALLAGALVLGISAVPTLAAWTDAEYATSTFSAGKFGVVSTTTNPATPPNCLANPSVFVHHATPPGAELQFTAPTLMPGTSSFAALDVMVECGSTLRAKLMLSAITIGPADAAFISALSYRVVAIGDGNDLPACNIGSFNAPTAWLTPDNTTYYALSSTLPPNMGAVTLPIPKLNPNQGDPSAWRRLCIELKLSDSAPNALQGQSLTTTWTFTSSSIEPTAVVVEEP